MEFKTLFGILGLVIGFISFIPYFIDIFKGKVKPHTISWLIWTLTTGVGAVAQFEEGAGFGSYILGLFCIVNFIIFLVSLKKGESTIGFLEVFSLLLALVSLFFLVKTTSLVIAVILVSLADGIGFIPTYKSVLEDYRNEGLPFWIITISSLFLSLLSLEVYNITTVLYSTTMMSLEIILVLLILYIGRKSFFNKNK